ncbi:hypothetical protein FZZ91_11450 [Synechococcus sp. HB1133]|uniref:hypothetical protein n=2 Tax=Synechococcus TaxID=1129 RepID=UPI00140E6F2A|nr:MULTISPECIES: hypothetical protein [unclassified Synechococcus]MCB4394233.1 hypothetical protein [Synechococcus sp. PH41509]MCB4423442.1 hypothetical protein [Synechococcus sp. HB1133]MCB4431447.1 hypothetical protein [Synechococcus sp. HBA1120]NHI82390.1 hypothetical protein [Synechococcus sp. HB1133]
MHFPRYLSGLLLGLPLASVMAVAGVIAVAAEDAPLAPEVQRRVAVVVLARRIRSYAAMAKASSDCLVEKGRLRRSQANQALVNTLEELGISRGVLTNPLVEAVSPRLQLLLDDSCALDPKREAEALQLARNEL